jgi:hypothetical protein
MCCVQIVTIFVKKAFYKVDISWNTTANSQVIIFDLRTVGMGPQEKEKYWDIKE